MVVRRTIEHLRERPHEERIAIAAWISIAVVAILFLGWIIYFFHTIVTTPAPDLQGTANPLNSSGLQQAQQQIQQAYASTTQFMDVEGNVETQQVGTSTGYSQ